MIDSENGTEFTWNARLAWQEKEELESLQRIRQADAEWHCRSFNKRLRDECLNEHM
jgi:hypothetical protein